MKREDFLKAFAEMSPEDQEAIRAELTGKGAPQEAGSPCGPMGMPEGMKEHMMEMMEKMKAGGDPMTMCKEMMEKMKGKC